MFRQRGSVQLARVLGIRIGASPSWFAFLFFMIWALYGLFDAALPGTSSTTIYVVAVLGAFLFFLSIALHELGHAVVARRGGIDVIGIDLWVFGGLAKLSREARSPGEEFRVAVAGPLVTLLLTVLGFVGVALSSRPGTTLDAIVGSATISSPVLALLAWLSIMNAALLAFNLVPGFPLDGGRIARAIAWRITGDRVRATRVAARLGQGFGYLLVAGGVLLVASSDIVDGLWLLVLGWFLSSQARAAVVASAFSQRLEGVTVADLMEVDPVAVPGAVTALDAQDEFFLRYRLPWFPVIDGVGRLIGVLREERVDGAVSGGRPALEISELVDDDREARVSRDATLESLLASPGLRHFGALLVVDDDGRLCGRVTFERVRRALTAAF
jgi:Zn-dependent protease